jgi:hypothetical protein
MKFPYVSFFTGKRDCEISGRTLDSRPSTTPFDLEARSIDSAPVNERPVPNRAVSSRGKSNRTLPEILADPGISSWLKEAIKMAYQQDPLDALQDAHRLIKVLGERYTQVVNRDLVH